jgi:hypothetical protein
VETAVVKPAARDEQQKQAAENVVSNQQWAKQQQPNQQQGMVARPGQIGDVSLLIHTATCMIQHVGLLHSHTG